MNVDEPGRLTRIAMVEAKARETFGDSSLASTWLHRPNRALGGNTPISLLNTDEGTAEVEIVLGRLEHGLFS